MIPYPPIRLPDGSFVSEPLLSALSPFLLAALLSPLLLRTRGRSRFLLLLSSLTLILAVRLAWVPSGFIPYGPNHSLLYPSLPLKPLWQFLLLSSLLLSLPLLGLRRSLILFLSLPLAFHASLLSAPVAHADSDYDKVPDPECSGGSWNTNNDSGGVTGSWNNPSWIPGSATGWGSGTATAMWNTSGNIIDQKTKVVYHAEYEKNDPVTGPNPPNVGYAYYSYPSDGAIHWFWDEHSTWGNQVEGYSYTWAPCKSITNYKKIYSATLSLRYWAWSDDFDGPQARSYLRVGLQKPGTSTYTEWTVADYVNTKPNTGWLTFTQDVKSYFQSAASNGSYNIRLYNFCHADCDAGDDEYFAWWVDYVHLYVYEDGIAPSITLSVNPNKQYYPDNTTITFSWSATDSGGSGLNSFPYAYAMDSSSPTNWGTTTSASYSTANLSEGTHTFYVRARDGENSMLEPNIATASFTFKVDKTAPSLSKSSGPDGGTWISSNSATFSWSASDSLSGVQGYKYSTDGGTSWTDTSSTSYTWSGLSEGIYTFKVRAYDQVGNYTEVTWSFGVDATAPSSPSSLSASPSGWASTNSFTVSWTNPSDLSGIAGAYYKLDSAPISSTDGTYVSGSGITSISGITVPGEGSHTIYLWLKDVAGNANHSNCSSTTLCYDNTPPPSPFISSSTHPTQGAWYSSNSPSFSWSCSDTSGIGGYSYVLNRSSSTIPDTISEGPGTSKSYGGLAEGIWYFHIRACNGSGLWGSTAHFQVNIDTTVPPAPSVRSPTHPNENTWYPNNKPFFIWACNDLSGIAGYSYALDAPPDDNVDTADIIVSFSNVDDGVHVFYVKAKNEAGLWGASASYTIRVGVAPESAPSPLKPSTLKIWPPSFSIREGESLMLTVTLLDPEGRPLGGKTIDWSANLGTLAPPSLVTDDLGRASVVYFAPEVEADTPVVVTASFAGDESYTPSAASLSGWVTSPRTAEILENLERAAEKIDLVEEAEEKLAVLNAVLEGRIGASLTVTIEVGAPGLSKEYESENFKTQLRGAKTGELVEVVVENVRPAGGTTILLNIEDRVIPVGQIREVLVDNVPAGLADDYEDVLDPTNDGGRCEYLILKGGRGAQILVSIAGFSSRIITIRGPLAAGKPWVPLVIAVNIVVIVVVLLLVFRRRPKVIQ